MSHLLFLKAYKMPYLKEREMAERLNALVLKTSKPAGSRVRIPVSPPVLVTQNQSKVEFLTLHVMDI